MDRLPLVNRKRDSKTKAWFSFIHGVCDATRSLGDICVFVIDLQTSPVNKVSEVKMIASVIP